MSNLRLRSLITHISHYYQVFHSFEYACLVFLALSLNRQKASMMYLFKWEQSDAETMV